MIVTTLTSRELSQDSHRAREAARHGPVFITEHGQPAHVLLTVEDYRRLVNGHMSLAEALADHHADFDFEPGEAGPGLVRPAGLG